MAKFFLDLILGRSIAVRLIWISVSFLLPVAVLFNIYIAAADKDIVFAEKELVGVAYLARVTDNMLQLARLDGEGLRLRLDWESAEELLGSVLGRVRARDTGRRIRARVLAPELFSDPCWDMLLDLYDAYLSGARLTVSALADGAGLPLTTTIRRLDLLATNELVIRTPDSSDRRRTFVELSDSGVDALARFFDNYLAAT